jgi:hypothetical protein
MKKYIIASGCVALFIGLYQYGQTAALSLTDVPNEAASKTIKDTINANNALIEAIEPANVPVASGKIIVGQSTGYGLAVTPSEDISLAVDGKMSLVTDAVATTNIADSAVTAAKLGTLMTNALVFATNSAGNVVGLYFTNGILRAAKVP